jgi:hypothetical protein
MAGSEAGHDVVGTTTAKPSPLHGWSDPAIEGTGETLEQMAQDGQFEGRP